MANLISFSLWGGSLLYNVGAIKNANLAQIIYPGWHLRYYCSADVPVGTLFELENIENVEVIMKQEIGNFHSSLWRFEAIGEDWDRIIFRDCDSRLNQREKDAVDEWIKSDKSIHLMRDHPYHRTPTMAGMWGCKGGLFNSIRSMLNEFKHDDKYGIDQAFLAKYVYPLTIDDGLVHDEFFDKKPFPSPRKGLEFVGEIFDENDNPVQEHRQVLKQWLENNAK